MATATRTLLAIAATAATVVALTPTAASAHASAQTTSAVAGSYGSVDIRIPHGCGSAATVTVTVDIGDGVTAVKPQRKPGWATDIDLDGDGNVTAVTWTADEPLPDGLYEDFGLAVKWPDTPGDTVFFPTIQTCVGGSEEAWVQRPDGDRELDRPAPAVTVDERGDTHEHGSHDNHTTGGDGTTATALLVLAGATSGVAVAGGAVLLRRHRTGN